MTEAGIFYGDILSSKSFGSSLTHDDYERLSKEYLADHPDAGIELSPPGRPSMSRDELRDSIASTSNQS